MKESLPISLTKDTDESNEEFLTEKSSGGTIPSLIEDPAGADKSRMIRKVPYFFGTAPNGEQWKREKGDEVKGPTVWPLQSSFKMARETSC